MRPSEQASPAAIRRERVFALRETGLTFREIGERAGISSSRASQIHADALRQRTAAPPPWTQTNPPPIRLAAPPPHERAPVSGQEWQARYNSGVAVKLKK